MDDIKLFAKNEKELETLIQVVRIYSQEIGMEFSLGKCAMLIMRHRKRHIMEGIELPNQEKTRMLREKETYLYLRILEADSIKQAEKKIKKVHLRITTGNQIYSRNLTKGINAWSVLLVKILGAIIEVV